MTFDDFIYSFLLLISLACGMLCSTVNTKYRKYLMSLFGFIFVLFSCWNAILHSLIVTLSCICVMCIRPKNFQMIVFCLCFGYLIVFRTIHLFGYPRPPSYANAVQLVLTLKLIGAAFEISDSLQRDKQLTKLSSCDDSNSALLSKLRLEIKYLNVKATFVDLFTYSYCFIGLLTGPYFKYRVYLDCANSVSTKHIDTSKLLSTKSLVAAGVGLAYLVSSHFFYIEYAKTDEFFSHSVIYRLLFMTAMFFVFRMRMYFAWVVSECVCMCARMGAYPSCSKPVPGRGPTDLVALDHSQADESHMNFETTRNLSIAGCEWAPTVREGMRSWNMTVQYWLATFVYRRFPIKSCRTAVTMLVSAFWHGVHPGYYLSFMTIPVSLQAESCLDTLLGASPIRAAPIELDHYRPDNLLRDWRLFVRWFYKMRVFDYCCMGFLLLEATATLRYWSAVYFSVHLVMLLCISLAALRPRGPSTVPP